MIKLVYCIRKRADISEAEFHRYWLEQHGPRVRSHAEALGASRYVQSHTFDSDYNDGLRESRGMGPAHDGITEMWWPDMETFEETMQSAGGLEAARDLLEDERGFIDLESSTLFLTEEHEIF